MIKTDRSSKKNRSLGRQVGLHVIVVTALLSISFTAIFVSAASRLIVADAKTGVDQVIANVVPFAEMAAYSTSKFSAAAALKLLSGSPWVARARIVDSFDDELASYRNPEIKDQPLSGLERRRINLNLGAGNQIYGVLEIDIVYRANKFARFFLYAGVGAIVLTSLSLAYLLFAVFQRRVVQPVTRLKSQLSDWPTTSPTKPLSHQDFGSQELDELSRTFQDALQRSIQANEERNRALAQRALIADAVNGALARADIFLATTGEEQNDQRMTFGAEIPDPMSGIIDSLTTANSDINRVVNAKSWDATVSMARRKTDSRDDGREGVTIVEVALPDERVWTLTCVDLDLQRRAVVGTETTELRKLSHEAEAARRLEAIGVLASGVAHDFNNVLAIIISAIGLHERATGSMPENLSTALRAAHRGAQVTRQLLDASRSDPRVYGAVDLSQLIDEIEPELRNILGTATPLNIRIETNSFVIAEAGQLHNTLVNLCVNARDASEPGNPIELLMRDATPDELRAEDLPHEHDFIVITISDSGVAIPKHVLPHIFEPFYTTKKRGQGTGLGLPLARSFALRSQGKIRLQSEPGIGTLVSLYLPSRKRIVSQTSSGPEMPGHEKRIEGLKVLVIEDEHDLLDSLLEFFRIEGCHVAGAGTLREAITLIETGSEPPFDIILSDIVLPDGSGVTLLDYVTSRTFPGQIILMGGNFDVDQLTPTQSRSMKAFLKKPFSLDEIVETILG
ncbi:MAG: ATP-binding protein [Hyphomicrobiaceae bacterium]